MERALRAAATGMTAQQLNIDVISNNIANVNTTGFKKSTVEFKDLVYQKIRSTHGAGDSGEIIPVEVQVGNGVKHVATTKMFMQGPLTETGNPMDIAIHGEGFLKVLLPDGTNAYTRDGAIKVDPEGKLVTAIGQVFQPEITIPEDTESIAFRVDGRVEVKLLGEHEFTELGQFELTRFINPPGLSNIGNNLYTETDASGPPIDGIPGEGGLGTLQQHYMEQSNVELVNEMVSMISAQRAYEINSKTIQTVDQMYDIANGLKR